MALRMFNVLPVEPLRRVMLLKGGCHPVIWVFHWVIIEAFKPFEDELLWSVYYIIIVQLQLIIKDKSKENYGRGKVAKLSIIFMGM
jgi:hypothetical protein